MAIGRISGSVLKSNLTRNGVDLAFETNLLYLDVTNSRVGIGTSEPTTTLQVNGTTTTTGLTANGAVNIDGTGTSNMDNVIIGANSAAAGTFTNLTANGTIDIDSTGNMDGIIIGANSAAAGTFTTATATNVQATNFKANDGTAAMTIADSTGDVNVSTNFSVDGNLTVNGTTTTIDSATLTVEDPLIQLAKNNSGGDANTFDQGLFFNRGSLDNVSFIWDESTDQFAFAVTASEDGTTAGNITIDSYANVRANVITGADVETGTISAADGTESATIANSTGVMTIASSVLTTADINGGAIDGTTIGANTAAAITGTTITGTLAGATGSTIGNLTFANGSITDSSGAISFGNENLTTTGTLTVSGLSYPSTDGTNGQVLQTDGAGNLTFVDLSIGDLVITGSTIFAPSNADLRLSTQGSGTVVINNLSFPIGDGSANQVLATNGAGQLTFVDSGAASTDSTEAGAGDESTDLGLGSTVINSFNVATYDSAFYFLVTRDEVNQNLDLRRHSLTHDDSVAVVNTFGQVRSDVSGSYITVDADVNSNLARLTATGQSVANSVSLYRIVLGQDTTASSSGNTAFIVNTDVDSTVENLDTWSASTYRGAQYFISATNSTTGESSNMEALVVTDGTDAFITPYGNVNTGNNDLIELSADVDTGSVRLRAFARTPNTRVAMYRILLGDSESSSSGTSVNLIGATSVSSASTTLDSFSSDDYHGAMYLVVAHNSTEGESSVQTVYMLNDGADAYHTTGPSVNSKGTNQLEFTSSFSGGTATLSCSSTSGSDTTVNAYRIHLKRGAANTVTTNTNQIITGEKTFTSALLIDTIRSPGSNADIKLEPQGTGDVVLNSLRSDDSSAVVIKDNLKVTGLTTDNAFLINAGDGTIGETTTLTVDPVSNYLGINQTSPEVTLHMTGEGAQSTQIRMEQYNDSGDAPDVRTRRYRGTIASPSAVQSGDYLFRSNHEYYNGTSLLVGGAFAFDNTNNANRTQFSVAVDTDGTGADPAGNNGQFIIDGNAGGRIKMNTAVALAVNSDPATIADYAHIYAKDEASSAGVFVKDEAGNVTKISPHNEQGEWEYYSRNVNTGKTVRINMEEMIRDIEKLTGKSYIKND